MKKAREWRKSALVAHMSHQSQAGITPSYRDIKGYFWLLDVNCGSSASRLTPNLTLTSISLALSSRQQCRGRPTS